MYYLEVAHVEDNDSDLFKFLTLESAVKYIVNNKTADFVLSDSATIIGGESEYTLVTE